MNLLTTITRAFQGQTDEQLEEEIQQLQRDLAAFQSGNRRLREDGHEGVDRWLPTARGQANRYSDAWALNFAGDGPSPVPEVLQQLAVAYVLSLPDFARFLHELVDEARGYPALSREERNAELARRQAEIDKRQMELDRRRIDREAKETKRHLADLRERAKSIGTNRDTAA